VTVLIDSSIWIDYFRNGKNSDSLNFLLSENQVAINNLILAEIVPFLKIKRQIKLIRLLESVENISTDINWNHITEMQVKCLKKGINKIGISDLIIAQNAIYKNVSLYSLDKHFKLISKHTKLKIWDWHRLAC